MRAVATGRQAAAVPVSSKNPTLAALGADLAGATSLGSGPAPRGTVLFSEAYSTAWHASSGAGTLRHQRTFGWANGYVLSSGGTVSIRNGAQWQRWAWLALEVAIWALVVVRWRRTRTRRRLATVRPDGPRGAGDRGRPRERRPDPLVEGLDDGDRYWWERV